MLEGLKTFATNFEDGIGYVAMIIAFILEIFGIIIITIGGFKAFYNYFKNGIKKLKHNIKIDLGNALALGLEFKMGAEILKTVVVREMNELIILGVIIVLRAILAFLIHWEIKNEKKESGEYYEEESLFNKLKKNKKEIQDESPKEEGN
ncbi:MAG: DUF1622 domain-containing protein [Acholeplasmatales bacterium]|nr:DUF1622 domain-containing protein [Acholeplasmatales bacterium]